jgi:hypothetical protein
MNVGPDHLSRHDFQRLAAFIQDYSGIKMPSTKQTMVEGRLRKRVAVNGLPTLPNTAGTCSTPAAWRPKRFI